VIETDMLCFFGTQAKGKYFAYIFGCDLSFSAFHLRAR